MPVIDLENQIDQQIMSEVIFFALNSVGNHRPNPPVGAALVFPDGNIVFGFHEKCGEGHAEVNVVKAAEENGYNVKDGKLYVSLEPCCFHGRTPACTDLILEKGIKEVIFGCFDPNPNVAGKGIAILKEAGLKVKGPVCEDFARFMIAPFESRMLSSQKILTVLKQATTQDGCIAASSGDSKWISNETARDLVHLLRTSFDAVLSPAKTIKADGALLTSRKPGLTGIKPLQNLRIALDRDSILDGSEEFFSKDPSTAIHLKGGNLMKRFDRDGVRVIELEHFRFSWPVISEILLEHDIRSLWVEAGGNFSDFLLKSGALDYYLNFNAGKILSGAKNLQSFYSQDTVRNMDQATGLSLVETKKLLPDTALSIWKIV